MTTGVSVTETIARRVRRTRFQAGLPLSVSRANRTKTGGRLCRNCTRYCVTYNRSARVYIPGCGGGAHLPIRVWSGGGGSPSTCPRRFQFTFYDSLPPRARAESLAVLYVPAPPIATVNIYTPARRHRPEGRLGFSGIIFFTSPPPLVEKNAHAGTTTAVRGYACAACAVANSNGNNSGPAITLAYAGMRA